MTMFLIQALLWLLVAFLLGYGIGRFLKSLFCRDRADEDVDVYTGSMTTPQMNTGKVDGSGPGISATTASVLGGAAAAAAGTVAVARKKLGDVDASGVSVKVPEVEVDVPAMSLKAPEGDMKLADITKVSLEIPKVEADLPELEVKAPAMDLSGIDPHKPIIDPPDLDIELPEIEVEAPVMDLSGIDPHKPIIDPPDLDIELPELELKAPAMDLGSIDPPDLDIELSETGLPDVEADLPDTSVAVLEVNTDLPKLDVAMPDMELPDVTLQTPEVSVGEGSDFLDITKGTVAVAGAGLVAKAASALDFSGIDPHKPIVDPPDLDIELPEVEVKAPTMDLRGIDPHKPIIDPPDLDIELPEVEVTDPTVDVELSELPITAPEVDVEVPDVLLKVPGADLELPDVPEVSPDAPKVEIDLPDMSLPAGAADLPEAAVETLKVDNEAGSDDSLLDIAKTAVIAAGSGLVATAVSASDDVQEEVITETAEAVETVSSDLEVGEEDDTNWLLVLVQRIKDEYQGRNPRAVSKLWDTGNSTYDCSALDEYESLTLNPAQYDKLGIIHCGVPRAGFVAVGGDVSSIEQGGAVLFHYPDIVVCRDYEDNHHFIRVTG